MLNNLRITLDPKSLEGIVNLKEKINKGVLKGFREGLFYIEGKIKERFGGPKQVKVVTGHLRRSIKSSVKQKGNQFEGTIGSNLVYSAIHEFGGLAGRNRMVKIPARPYIGPGIKIGQTRLQWYIDEAVKQEIAKQ